jgi:hypothetical protein
VVSTFLKMARVDVESCEYGREKEGLLVLLQIAELWPSPLRHPDL